MEETNKRKGIGASTSSIERLKSEREKRGWSRDYVAEKIGSDTHTIGRWERGNTFPSPYYRQELCKLFSMNAEELGFLKEEIKDSPKLHALQEEQPVETTNPAMEQHVPLTNNSPPQKLIVSNHNLRSLIVTGIFITVITTLLAALFSWGLFSPSLSLNSRTSPDSSSAFRIRPGGTWINPANGSIVQDTIRFAAKAYPTHPGDPPINHVNFTVGWNGAWRIGCTAYPPPATDNIFACTTNLPLLNAPVGRIKSSFDVYDQVGNMNLAPNGVHTLFYKP